MRTPIFCLMHKVALISIIFSALFIFHCGDNDGEEHETMSGHWVMRGQWTVSSPPSSISLYDVIDARFGQYSISSRWRQFYWYNPYEQVDVKEIWPNLEPYAREGRTDVLVFEFTPNDSTSDSWAGVMRALPEGDHDQSGQQYIDIWVNGNRGIVNIDAGRICEDVIPNRRLDSEDVGVDVGLGDGLLDIDEDIGLDGMANDDPRAISAEGDFWDVDGDSVKDVWEPFSDDDWSYQSGSSNYTNLNGTEANRSDPDRGMRPDTEDLNGNGLLDTENDFFRFSFSLSPESPDTILVADGDTNKSNWGHLTSWRLYRISLIQPTEIIGAASLTNIQYVRLWITGVNTFTKLRFASIDFAGNEGRKNRILNLAN